MIKDSVCNRFETTAVTYKDNVAIDSDQDSLTYQELNDLANKVAAGLSSVDVNKGEIVIVSMTRSIEFLVSILAITKIGAVYLPVRTDSTLDECQHILAETNSKLVLTNTSYNSNFRDVNVIAYDELRFPPEFKSPKIDKDPEDCFYIMYTSGSTGNPKGVMVPDRAVLRLVVDADYIDISSDDAIYLTADISFDASTFEIWGALLNGARIIIDGEHFDHNRFAKNVVEKKATIAWLTSGLFHILGANKPQIFRPLRVLLAGGDVLNQPVIASVLNSCPDLQIINGYGPTENTTFTCCYPMTARNLPEGNVPIGYPINGTKVYVLDEELQPVNEGGEGTLYVSGEGVALGYLNKDNDNAFFNNTNICDGQIYNTGDLVRQRNGILEYIGRVDNLYKIRGYRVSIEFVTQNFYKLDYVENVLLYVRKDISKNNSLCASITTTNKNICLKEVRDDIAKLVPSYMIPDFIDIVENIKLNKNGKLDRSTVERSFI